MKAYCITTLIVSFLSVFSVGDEITGLSLKAGTNSQAVNPTAVAGAVLSLDANKRPTFGHGVSINPAGSVLVTNGGPSTSFHAAEGFYLPVNGGLFFSNGTNGSSGVDLFLYREAAATLRLGAAASATPVAQTLTVQPASGANVAGADFTISGSQSTGSAAGGKIVFKYSEAGGAGSGVNSLAEAVTIGIPRATLPSIYNSTWGVMNVGLTNGVTAFGATAAGNSNAALSHVGFAFRSGMPIGWSTSANDPYAAGSNVFQTVLYGDTAATLQLGADAAGATTQTIKAADRITSDGIGSDLVLQGGNGRGAAGGSLIFKTSPAAGAGVTGTPTTALTIDSSQNTRMYGTHPRIFAGVNDVAGFEHIGSGQFGIHTVSNDYSLYVHATGIGIPQNGYIDFRSAGINTPEAFILMDSAGVLQLGTDHATTPTAQTLKAHDVTTGTGASMTIAGGKGSVAGGSVILATSATNAAPIPRNIVYEGAAAATNTVAATIATISCTNGKTVGGELLVTVEAEEGGNVTSITEHSTFVAVSAAGTTTPVIQAAPSTSTAATTNAGTLSLAHGVTAPGGNTFTLTVTPTSSYGGPTITIRYQLRINASDAGTTVTLP